MNIKKILILMVGLSLILGIRSCAAKEITTQKIIYQSTPTSGDVITEEMMRQAIPASAEVTIIAEKNNPIEQKKDNQHYYFSFNLNNDIDNNITVLWLEFGQRNDDIYISIDWYKELFRDEKLSDAKGTLTFSFSKWW